MREGVKGGGEGRGGRVSRGRGVCVCTRVHVYVHACLCVCVRAFCFLARRLKVDQIAIGIHVLICRHRTNVQGSHVIAHYYVTVCFATGGLSLNMSLLLSN